MRFSFGFFNFYRIGIMDKNGLKNVTIMMRKVFLNMNILKIWSSLFLENSQNPASFLTLLNLGFLGLLKPGGRIPPPSKKSVIPTVGI